MPFLFIAMKTRLLSFLLLFLLVCSAQSQTYQPTEENLKSRQEFRDNRFGIFLHWGDIQYAGYRRMDHDEQEP